MAIVALIAGLVLVAILFTVTRADPGGSRGYAEFTMFPRGCQIDRERRLNVRSCLYISRGVYVVNFATSLEGGTAVVTLGSCCVGRVGASIVDDRVAVVALPRIPREPVRASIVVP